MIAGVHTEVLLAGGYALFLVMAAASLEALAWFSHRRSGQYRTMGFKYHPEFDHWECPLGEHLRRSEVDPQRRIVRYRAPSHVCNACYRKPGCTDSNDGREIERRIDSWLESEIRRFHRGISLALLLLAGLILTAELIHYTRPRDMLVLGCLFAPISAAGARLFWNFVSR